MGLWLILGSSTVAEEAAGTRFEVPIARVADNAFSRIGLLLDMGLLDVNVPLVNTPEEAAAAAV